MRCGFIVVLLSAAILTVGATAASARPPGTNGKIVTNSDNRVTGEEQVYSVDPDGSDRHLVANNSEVGQWSPDGSLLTLFGDAGERLFNPDTGTSRDLGLPDGHYPGLQLFCGVWSPDGTRLACEGFGTTDPSLNGVFTVRSSDGGDLQRVTSDPYGDDCPSDYSPNGNQLVVTRANDNEYGLFTVKVDGGKLRQITPDGMQFNFCNGSWSPQGNEIVLSAHTPDFDFHSSIWVVHEDGSGLRELPVAGCGGPNSDPAAFGCFNPSWSPDGTKVVFGRRQGNGQADLFTANADGSGLSPVTNTPDIDEAGGDWGTHPVTP
jgi:Tol biopolymer transport system component